MSIVYRYVALQVYLLREHVVNVETSCIPKPLIFNTLYVISILYGITFGACIILVKTLSALVAFLIPTHFISVRSIYIEMACYFIYICAQVVLLVMRQIYPTFLWEKD